MADARARDGVRAPLVSREVLDGIRVPPEVVEIRAYVRWEEAGMPSDTTDEWRQREYDEALLDLKIELLSGVTMNEIRGRYRLPPVDGGDAKMFNPDEELAKRVAAAAAIANGNSPAKKTNDRRIDSKAATEEFIESVVTQAPIMDVVVDVVVDEESEEAEETVAEAPAAIKAVVADVEIEENVKTYDMDQIVDAFSALTPEEIEDMERALGAENWSTREQLISAIRASPTDVEHDAVNDELREQLELTKSALASSEQSLAMVKMELEDLEVEIVLLQATSDKALKDANAEWAAEIASLEAQIKQATAQTGMSDAEVAKTIEAYAKKVEDAERAAAFVKTEYEKMKSELDAAKTSAIRAEAHRDASAEVILMLKKELTITREELKETKAKAVSEIEFAMVKKELDNAWEAAAELQEMWDGDRKVIELLTKSLTDENAKKEARKALDIPAAYKGVLGWARKKISRRTAAVTSATETTLSAVSAFTETTLSTVSAVTESTLSTVSAVTENTLKAYQELEAKTGEFSDDVIPEDYLDSDFMPR